MITLYMLLEFINLTKSSSCKLLFSILYGLPFLESYIILINLVEQLLELLGGRNFTHHYQSDDPFAQLMAASIGNLESAIEQPEDPVLRRLLPNAYADPESAAEFRKYSESSLPSKPAICLSCCSPTITKTDSVDSRRHLA